MVNPTVIDLQHATLVRAGKPIFIDISLRISHGDRVAILGPTGVGKSSLLMVIATLLPLTSGHLIAETSTLMQQRPALLPWLSAVENVRLGARMTGAEMDRSVAVDWLDQVGLADSAATKPAALSGGQQQRVALARALAQRPKMLLLDEPFSALDLDTRERLRADVQALQQQLGFTLVLVTHETQDAMALCQRQLRMTSDGLTEATTPTTANAPSWRLAA